MEECHKALRRNCLFIVHTGSVAPNTMAFKKITVQVIQDYKMLLSVSPILQSDDAVARHWRLSETKIRMLMRLADKMTSTITLTPLTLDQTCQLAQLDLSKIISITWCYFKKKQCCKLNNLVSLALHFVIVLITDWYWSCYDICLWLYGKVMLF